MTTVNERIKEIRKELGLSQEEFANQLYMKRNSIAQLEIGIRNPSERTLKSICNKFSVSLPYLQDGTGDMFVDVPDIIIDQLINAYKLDSEWKDILKKILALNPEEQEIFKNFFKTMFDIK